jgi:hypothetical protein
VIGVSAALALTACEQAKEPSPSENAGAAQGSAPAMDSARPTAATAANFGLDSYAPKTGAAGTSAAASVVQASAQPGAQGQPTVDTKPGTDPLGAALGAAVQGPAVSGEGFKVYLEAQPSYPVAKPGHVRVVLLATAPFHCNDKYPYKFTTTASDGIEFTEPVVRNANIGAERSTIEVPFTPQRAGKLTLNGELSFSVCTDDKCLIEKQALSVPVEVSGS